MLSDRELLNVIRDFRDSDWVAIRLVHDGLDIRLVKRRPGEPLPAEFNESVDPVRQQAPSGVGKVEASGDAGGASSAGHISEAGPEADQPAREPVGLDHGPSRSDTGTLEDEHLIVAGTLGSFWVAPAPGAEPFVRPGDSVVAGQQVAIIEVMKLMVEVLADQAGTVAEVLAENGDLVQAGQPLFRIVPKGAGE
ncbi:acetyl-CoA carboxylase [Intrasporangium chromatireducens Q5-1]|uniref:Biotin carboxyl carrier protein of acetyl-CoA carboxylase n=1 Tax=Intrasporangium chromatireducens Q5-1 TaxID=584657 RepID=W9GN36_9MICO|nr:biotin/lipoyl-containing protein [Intrasporangium chromatireducens]EWT05319.1 acetyl-CoA carboxylase [Intrasporangium chromatireducens Q5-1]